MTARRTQPLRWHVAVALAVGMAALGACGGGAGGGVDQAWRLFESGEGRFRVALPGEPTRRQAEVGEASPETALVRFTTQLDDATMLEVSYGDYPDAITEIEPRVVLTGAITGSVDRFSGTLAAQTPLTAEGSPAVDYLIQGDGGWLQARAILVANRLYVLQVAAPDPDAAAFERLVTSFELL